MKLSNFNPLPAIGRFFKWLSTPTQSNLDAILGPFAKVHANLSKAEAIARSQEVALRAKALALMTEADELAKKASKAADAMAKMGAIIGA